MDVNNKILKDHVFKDFEHGSYHNGKRIAITFMPAETAIISPVYNEGSVLF